MPILQIRFAIPHHTKLSYFNFRCFSLLKFPNQTVLTTKARKEADGTCQSDRQVPLIVKGPLSTPQPLFPQSINKSYFHYYCRLDMLATAAKATFSVGPCCFVEAVGCSYLRYGQRSQNSDHWCLRTDWYRVRYSYCSF